MNPISSSFRDPNGFIFEHNGEFYRQINHSYSENYDLLMSSGLYEKLVKENLLVPHTEDEEIHKPENAYKIIKPEKIPFISYPYEWSFSELKNAAKITLQIQKIALEFGMSLKDASTYNIQFLKDHFVFIDTLSFEKYVQDKPWVAYKQFCQHFLAPLALMSYKDIRLNQLLRIFIDGVPLDLASSLLPSSSLFKFSSLSHIHLHAKSQKHYSDKKVKTSESKLSLSRLKALVQSLEGAVNGLKWKPEGTEWSDYYEDTNYSDESFNQKKQIVENFLEKANPNSVWDLGANEGVFSRISSNKGIKTMSFDIDPSAVEKNYLHMIHDNEENLLPLLLDLTNPPAASGWSNTERQSLIERGKADLVLALALIHHLSISNNVPFRNVASFFSSICDSLIIEFVPKEDSQVQRLLASREDIFSSYDQEHFEQNFELFFDIIETKEIPMSKRTIYLMKAKES
jgi:ribosomal protein L11 methylase PrmA